MHTYTEHMLVNLVGRWCQETPDTGRVWGSELAVKILPSSCASCFIHLASFTFPSFSALPSFHYFPGQPPSASPISLTSPPFSPLLSPLSHHPHCPFLLSPFPQTMYTVCWGRPSIFLKGTPPPLSTTRRMFPDCKWPFPLPPATFLLYHPSPHFLANRGHIVVRGAFGKPKSYRCLHRCCCVPRGYYTTSCETASKLLC